MTKNSIKYNKKRFYAICQMIFLIILVLLVEKSGFAFVFSGNLSNDYKYSHINHDSLLNKNNILDIKPDVYYMKFRATGKDRLKTDYINYYFKLRGELNFDEDYDVEGEDRIYHEGKSFFTLDALYIDAELSPHVYFLIGKERVLWGNGLVWNPVDVINPRQDWQNPKHDEEGAYITKGEFALGHFNLTLYYHALFIDEDNTIGQLTSNAAMKLNFLFSGIELNTYCYQRLGSQDYNQDPTLGFTFNYLFPYLDLNIYTDIIWERNSEYTYFKNGDNNYDSFKKEGQDIFSEIVGINFIHRANFETNVGLEFYHHGKGCTRNEKENYFNRLKSYYKDMEALEAEVEKMEKKEGEYENLSESALSEKIEEYHGRINALEGTIKNTLNINQNEYLNKDYLALRFRLGEVFNMIDFSNTLIFSMRDFDLFYETELEVHLLNNLSVMMSSSFFVGKSNEYSEFGSNPIKEKIEGSIKFVF